MPAWRVNNVPICMYLATHFYFTSYHVFANLVLRRACTGFQVARSRSRPRALAPSYMSHARAYHFIGILREQLAATQTAPPPPS